MTTQGQGEQDNEGLSPMVGRPTGNKPWAYATKVRDNIKTYVNSDIKAVP